MLHYMFLWSAQSSEPRFESPLLPFRRSGNCVLSTVPQFINEHLDIDGGGNYM